MTTRPDINDPKHDLSLTDADGTTIDVMLVDTLGRKDPRALQVGQVEPTAIKFTQGQGSYDDMTPPWMVAAQEDWSGGRGSKDFEKDRSRFSDSFRANTWREGSLMLGPMEAYATLSTTLRQHMPSDLTATGVTWGDLYSSTRYWSSSWAQAGTPTCDEVFEVFVRKIGSPDPLTVQLKSDSGGDPDAVLISGTEAGSSLDTNESCLLSVTLNTTYTFSAATFHIVTIGAATDDADNHWKIGTATGTTGGKFSGDGSSWTGSKRTLYYRILDSYTPATKSQTGWVPFEYKGAQYAYTQPPTGNSFLYINGDRGVCDSNSGSMNTLRDHSKAWANDLYNGCIAMVTAGPGSEEEQPWRNITDTSYNAGNPYVIVSPDWNVEHTTDTEYVILKSDKLTSLLDLGAYVTDHAVTEDYVYFARGDAEGTVILRYRWYNNSGAEATGSAAEGVKGVHLLTIRHPEDRFDTLYIAQNNHDQYGAAVGGLKVPGTWNRLFSIMGQLEPTNSPWTDRNITDVDSFYQSGRETAVVVKAGFGTGIIAAKVLDAAVDITTSHKLGVWMKSTTAVAASVLKLVRDDFVDTPGATLTAATTASMLVRNTLPGAAYLLDASVGSPAPTYVRMNEAVDGDLMTCWAFTDASPNFQLDTANAIIVMADFKFKDIYFNLGTFNAVDPATMTAMYFGGEAWRALSITDGTRDVGLTYTLAQDGSVVFTAPIDWERITITQPYNVTGNVPETAYTGYAIRLSFSTTLTDAIAMIQIAVSRYNDRGAPLSALVANEWSYAMTETHDFNTYPYSDDSQIQSIGLYLGTDLGLQTYRMRGGIDLLQNDPDWKPIPGKITGLEMYRPNDSDPHSNPVIFTETLLYEMQTQNDDDIVPFCIGELAAFQSEKTGRVHCVNGPYLYFTAGEEKLERYYNNNLDDIGPDTDEGLPSERRGSITALLSYPGHVFAAVSHPDNTASILRLKGSSWHEVYRAPRADAQIKNLYHQTIPGDGVGRLWFDQGGDLLYIPVVSGDPREADSYKFTHEGRVISGYIYGGMKDIYKIWKSLKIFNENASSYYYAEADYRLDMDTAWTEIDGTFDTEPSEELEFDSDYPSARRLQYRVRIQSKYSDDSPDIEAIIVDLFGVADVHNSISFSTILEDDYVSRNVKGKPEKAWGGYNTALLAMDQAETWRDNGTALTLGSKDNLPDNKQVAINQIVYYRAGVEKEQVTSGAERWVVQFLCHEI